MSKRIRLDRVEGRKELEPRRDPFWHRVSQGRYIGYRKLTAGSTGTWLARDRCEDAQAYVYEPLGDFSDLTEKQRFDAAKTAAEGWWRHRDSGGSGTSTVKGACEAYVQNLRVEKSVASAKDAEGRLKRVVYGEPLSRVELLKLRPRHFAVWKHKLMNGGMAKGTFNRNAASLRAALNLAHERNDVTSDFAWRKELRPYENADSRRELFLSRADRRALVEHASLEARPLIRAMTLCPFRPGDVPKLRVEHFDAHQKILKVPHGKTKVRIIPLGADLVAHFAACAKDKLPQAWLVSRADGSAWNAAAWSAAVREAAAKAGLPRTVCAYNLRHAAISDLLTAGLDPFTCAELAGTSVAMIQRFYGHLQAGPARAALERLSLEELAK